MDRYLQAEEERQLQIEIMRIMNTREILREKMQQRKYLVQSEPRVIDNRWYI